MKKKHNQSTSLVKDFIKRNKVELKLIRLEYGYNKKDFKKFIASLLGHHEEISFISMTLAKVINVAVKDCFLTDDVRKRISCELSVASKELKPMTK